jgi:hypothetical protein
MQSSSIEGVQSITGASAQRRAALALTEVGTPVTLNR